MKTSLCGTPVFLSLLTLGLAQVPDPPVEAVLEEFVPVQPRVSVTNPAQDRLSATILPVGRGSQVRGELVFIPGGDQVLVIGRIRGLERDRRYQWLLLPVGVAPGPGVRLGMWTADARGMILVDTIIPRSTLARFPQGLLGGTVLILRAPPLDPPAARPAVGSGEIRRPG